MTTLTIAPEIDATAIEWSIDVPELIAERLAEVGVRYERWDAPPDPDGDGDGGTATDRASVVDDASVVAAYAAELERERERGLTVVTIEWLTGDGDPAAAMRAAIARSRQVVEHRHPADEARLVVTGRAAYYLRVGGRVHVLVCGPGDFVVVPARTRHWFDIGAAPQVVLLDLARADARPSSEPTGDALPGRFPTLDELPAG